MWNMVTLEGNFEGAQSWDVRFLEEGWGEELQRFSIDQLTGADLLLFGRRTYEGMASYWPSATGTIADLMNGIAKLVFSRTLKSAEWTNTRLVRADAEGEVGRLKQASGKDILVFGSAELCDSLRRANLIDEYRLGLNPIVLGSGHPLFKPGVETKMRLLDVAPLKTGCVVLRYAPAAR
jgi:dihydrofolate reductase